jgi:hypothetical protein
MQNDTISLRSARRNEEVHNSSGRTGYQRLLSAVLGLALLAQGCPATVRAQAPNSPSASAPAANAVLAVFFHRSMSHDSILRVHQPGSDSRVEAAVIAGSGLAPGFGSTGDPPTLQRARMECRHCKKHKSRKLKARSGSRTPVLRNTAGSRLCR